MKVLVAIWFIISLTRLGYNYTKIYTQERDWLFLSDYEKRVRLFGEDFIKISQPDFCDSKPEIPLGSRLYYFNFYYLYPNHCHV